MQKREKRIWSCLGRVLSWDVPLVMGILNVTPDSFYAKSRKGGLSLSGLLAAAGAMCRGGAAIVDIGGESTRPGATPVSPQEEIRRVVPVVEALVGQLPEVCVSVDTRHVEVARAAVVAGAAIINDVQGCDPEPGMWELVAESGAGYVMTHARGTPETMDGLTGYKDVVGEVEAALREATERLVALGAVRGQIAWDPGLGFAKTHADSWKLLGATARFAASGQPVLIGASRKRFLGGECPEARGPASVGVAIWAAAQGAAAVRVHDVPETAQAMRAFLNARDAYA